MLRSDNEVRALIFFGFVGLLATVFIFERSEGGEGPETYPTQVLIVRHGEKTTDEKDINLSDQGKKRAAALPGLFEKSEQRVDPFPPPDFIFAAKNSKHSHRATETVAPLAEKLNLTVNSEFENERLDKLVVEIFHNPKYAGKTVLICWHHGTIPDLAGKLKVSDAPAKWEDKVFDRVWQITYDESGQAAFRDRPQQLLPKDAKK